MAKYGAVSMVKLAPEGADRLNRPFLPLSFDFLFSGGVDFIGGCIWPIPLIFQLTSWYKSLIFLTVFRVVSIALALFKYSN